MISKAKQKAIKGRKKIRSEEQLTAPKKASIKDKFESSLAAVGFFLFIAYGAHARSLEQWLETWPWVAGIIYFLGVGFLIFRVPFLRKTRLTFIQFNGLHILILVASLVLGAAYYAIGVSIKDSYIYVTGLRLTIYVAMTYTALFTAITGWLLFKFRQKLRATYGATEALVGIAVAVNRVAREDLSKLSLDSSLFLALLTAGVYLVVRGLDNIHVGMTKDPIDPVARKLAAFFGIE